MIAALYRMAVAIAIGFIPVAAIAQVIPPSEQPGRERERFEQPQAPLAQPGGAAIALPSTTAPAGAEKVSIAVRDVRIVGATVYRAEDLRPLYADLVGHTVPLKAIYDLAARLTAKYGNDGYVLSRAIVPPQRLDPKGAVVRIEVVEGYVDKVVWPGALSRYRDFFSVYAANITAERPVNIRTIERYLLLAGDLPGLAFRTSLKPSADKPGASTLVVEVKEKRLDAIARLDNRGTQARGPIQFLSSATVNNLLGQHEALTVTYAGATQLNELQYVAGNYRQVLNTEGLTFFVNGSDSWGKPGTVALETLEFKTLGTVVETGLSYPLVRSRERNLTLGGLFFASDSHSDVLQSPFNEDRLRGVRVRADGDMADPLGGINQYGLIYSQGFDGLGSTQNGNLLASRAAGRVDFSKLEANANHLQPLGHNFSAFLAAYGQYAFTPLLSPEQCGYGGRFFGRAFDPSQILGDSCFEGIGELRYDVPLGLPLVSAFQLYGFGDYGQLWTRDAAVGTTANVTAASAGAGVRLGWLGYLNTDLQVAKAVEGPRDDWRFFFAAVAKY